MKIPFFSIGVVLEIKFVTVLSNSRGKIGNLFGIDEDVPILATRPGISKRTLIAKRLLGNMTAIVISTLEIENTKLVHNLQHTWFQPEPKSSLRSNRHSPSNDLIAFHTDNSDSSGGESDIVSHLVEWECPPSTESPVLASSQSDSCFTNFDSMVSNGELE